MRFANDFHSWLRHSWDLHRGLLCNSSASSKPIAALPFVIRAYVDTKALAKNFQQCCKYINKHGSCVITICCALEPVDLSCIRQCFHWSDHALAHVNGPTSTHWGQDKMAAIFQTTFSNAFSWKKMFEFRLKFHWSLFPGVQLTILQHWLRQWLGADQATSHYLNQCWLDHRRIYASLGLNELKGMKKVSGGLSKTSSITALN